MIVYAFPTAISAADPWELPAVEDLTSIRDGRTGKPIAFSSLLDDLQHSDMVFVGESHSDEVTHLLQLYLYEKLLQRSDGKVVLAMEMFNRDDQASVDAYLADEITEEKFVEDVELWSNYREAYRPLLEKAKQEGAPVIASNFPKPLLRRIAIEGQEGIDALSNAERSLVPRQILPNSEAYWRRVDNAIRGHAAIMSAPTSDSNRLNSVQSLWDNAMGDSCVRAKNQFPDHLVLHINGGFHSAYWDGTVHQARLRAPKAKIKTIAISPTPHPASEHLSGLPVADYVALVEARATNIDGGTRGVTIGRELEYVLHEPTMTEPDVRVPLLIWLPDSGLTAEEVLPHITQQFGEYAMVVVLQPPYKSIGADLAIGGRWFWPQTFSEDTATIANGLEKIWAYLLRHFPIDPKRVCLAGEGTGATVVAAAVARTDRASLQAVAIKPREFVKLRDLPLLLPELYRPGSLPSRSLTVIAEEKSEAWWSAELDQYKETKIHTRLLVENSDPWARIATVEKVIVDRLGVDMRRSEQPGAKGFLRLASDTPRQRLWANIQAKWIEKQTSYNVAVVEEAPDSAIATEISTTVTPNAALKPGVLPRCPGPFGGTTVVLLPANSTQEEQQSWFAIEQNDPLNAKSRFHRVRVATINGSRPIPEVLTKLHSENRNNVLVVPAVFYADARTLRQAENSTKPFADDMTIQWQPGLGGQIGSLKLPVSSDRQ